jgi:hypothetical protein
MQAKGNPLITSVNRKARQPMAGSGMRVQNGAMNLEQALRDLSEALAVADGARDRLRAARRVSVNACLAALGIEPTPQPSLPQVIHLALSSPDRAARAECAVFLMHALAVPNLVPVAAYVDLCALTEGALRGPLLRGHYPFGTTVEDRTHALTRLSARIGELMEPMEPTFPNWPGLYAG